MGRKTSILTLIILSISIAFPIFMSEQIGGWTKKYTSKIKFEASKIPNLSDKVAIVTGSNTGIGYQTALELARANATVIVAARSEAKGIAAVKEIQKEVQHSKKIQFLKLDLSSLDSVEQFTTSFLKLGIPLHVLMLNAGVMKSPGENFGVGYQNYGFETTEDGFEYHIGVNHIGHAYLTKLLLPKLKQSAPSRIVSVSSMAEMGAPPSGMIFDRWLPKDGIMPQDYEDGLAYGQSKLANLMYTKELAKRLDGTSVSAYSLHPGVITSDLTRYLSVEMENAVKEQGRIAQIVSMIFGNLFEMALFNVKDGALTQLYVATAEEGQLVNGGFYHPIGNLVDSSHPQGLNETLSSILWDETERAISKRNKYRY